MGNVSPKLTLLRPGYRPGQVNRCFGAAHEIYNTGELDKMDSKGVRTVAFDVVLRDYQPQAVDTTLNQLEAASLQHHRTVFVTKNGHQAWMNQITQFATTLYPCLSRPAGERFTPASGQDYNKTGVDALMGRIVGYLDSDTTLTSSEVCGAVFHRTRGNKAYSGPSVDRYLTRVIEVLLSVE